jgi:sulfur-oxidizing protein SoxZ
MADAIVSVPATARRGEVIEIKALVRHPMETGFRHTQTGERIPRNIITNFACRYDGVEIFRATLHPSITANPLFLFFTVATQSGSLEFRWTGDNGFSLTETAKIVVS